HLIGLGHAAADDLAGEAAEARVLDPQTQRMGHVITKAEPVIDAVARTPRIARDDRCPGEERTGVGLYVTQPTIERQAAHEFPAGVDVGIPRARSHVAEVEPRSRPDGQSRAARAQRVFVAGVE